MFWMFWRFSSFDVTSVLAEVLPPWSAAGRKGQIQFGICQFDALAMSCFISNCSSIDPFVGSIECRVCKLELGGSKDISCSNTRWALHFRPALGTESMVSSWNVTAVWLRAGMLNPGVGIAAIQIATVELDSAHLCVSIRHLHPLDSLDHPLMATHSGFAVLSGTAVPTAKQISVSEPGSKSSTKQPRCFGISVTNTGTSQLFVSKSTSIPCSGVSQWTMGSPRKVSNVSVCLASDGADSGICTIELITKPYYCPTPKALMCGMISMVSHQQSSSVTESRSLRRFVSLSPAVESKEHHCTALPGPPGQSWRVLVLRHETRAGWPLQNHGFDIWLKTNPIHHNWYNARGMRHQGDKPRFASLNHAIGGL